MIRHIHEALRLAGVKPSAVDVVPGGNHLKVFMDGRLAAITPYSPKHPDVSAKWLAAHLTRAR